ncbi:MAG: CPBP family intramembrane glutamic endopeptidase [Rhodoferax sp.]
MLFAAAFEPGPEGRKTFLLSGATLLMLALALPASWLALNSGLPPVKLANLQQALWMLVCAPVIEEVVFRRILQKNLGDFLSQRFSQHSAAVCAALISAVVFALCHGYRVGPQWMVLWLVPGLALAEIWRRERSVWICILVHAYFNGSIWITGVSWT